MKRFKTIEKLVLTLGIEMNMKTVITWNNFYLWIENSCPGLLVITLLYETKISLCPYFENKIGTQMIAPSFLQKQLDLFDYFQKIISPLITPKPTSLYLVDPLHIKSSWATHFIGQLIQLFVSEQCFATWNQMSQKPSKLYLRMNLLVKIKNTQYRT